MSEAQPAEVKATIRMSGQEMENFEVPIDIFLRVLAGLQQIIEEKQQQERRQSKGISLACDGRTAHRESSIKSGGRHCQISAHDIYLPSCRLLKQWIKH